MPRPTIAPADFVGEFSPQAGVSHDFTVSGFPSNGRLTTRVVWTDAAAATAVTRVVVNEVQTVTFTPDGDPLPPGTQPQPQTEFILVPVREGDGSTPLEVERGDVVKVTITVTGFADGLTEVRGSVLVEGDTWDTAAAAVAYRPNTDIVTTYASFDLAARQGESVSVDIQTKALAGPPVDVFYELNRDAEATAITMDSPTFHLDAGEVAVGALTFHIGRDCPTGRRFLSVKRKGGSLSGELVRTLEIKILPAPITAPGPTAAQIRAKILERYERLGSHRSALGLPVVAAMPLVATANGSRVDFRGGNILHLASNGEIVAQKQLECEVWFMGLECQIRQEGTDEVYGGVGVLVPGSALGAKTEFPDDGDGTWPMGPTGRRVQQMATRLYKGPPMDIVLQFKLVESDSGDTTAIKREIAAGLAKATQALGAMVGIPAEALAAGDGFLNKVTFGLVQGVADVFGINDDEYPYQQLLVRWPDIQRNLFKRQTLQRSDDPHSFEYTHSIIVTGIDEGDDLGQYAAYFDIRLESRNEQLP